MTLLSGVFLGDLQFDGFAGPLQAAKQRRNGFANLEIDWAVFNLKDYVVGELAVEGMKNIISGFGAIVLQFLPVKVMVVDEAAIEKISAMRLQRFGHDICGIRGCATVDGGAGTAFGIRF